MAGATLALDDGQVTAVVPGDFIGRSPSAALHLSDPRISEAHAMVTLREGELCLLALRGRLRMDGAWRERIALREGQKIALSPEVNITVRRVLLPGAVLVARFDGQSVVSLDRPRCWSRKHGWVTRSFAEAELRFWMEGDQGYWDRGSAPVERLQAGVIETSAGPLHIERVEVRDIELAATEASPAQGPLTMIVAYDVVRFRRQDEPVGAIGGLGARLLSELAILKNARWPELTSLLWSGEPEAMRGRLDTLIWRTRRRLEALAIDPQLLSTDGNGLFFLRLGAGDEVVDET